MSVDAVVFSAVAKVQRQLAGFYGDEIAVDYLTHPSRTAEEVDTWLENPDNQARLARVYNSVLGFNRMGQYGYGRLIGSGTALTVLAASTAAVQALSYNTEFRTAILSHDPALINALANGPARDYLLAQHPAELAGWLASTAAATLTTLLDDHMTAMQDVMANPVCAPILMGDPATKNQLINYPALIDAIAATNDGLDAVLNDAAAWQTIVESETLLAAWLESSRAVERLALNSDAMALLAGNSSGVLLAANQSAIRVIASYPNAIQIVTGSNLIMEAIVNNVMTMQVIAFSEPWLSVLPEILSFAESLASNVTAMDIILSSDLAMQNLFASDSFMTVVAAEPLAMQAISSSDPALDVVIQSASARKAVLDDVVALNALFSTMLARSKVFYSVEMCNELFDNPTATAWLDSNFASQVSSTVIRGRTTDNITNMGCLVLSRVGVRFYSAPGQVVPGGGFASPGDVTFNIRCKPLQHRYGSETSNTNNTSYGGGFNYIVMEE